MFRMIFVLLLQLGSDFLRMCGYANGVEMSPNVVPVSFDRHKPSKRVRISVWEVSLNFICLFLARIRNFGAIGTWSAWTSFGNGSAYYFAEHFLLQIFSPLQIFLVVYLCHILSEFFF